MVHWSGPITISMYKYIYVQQFVVLHIARTVGLYIAMQYLTIRLHNGGFCFLKLVWEPEV